MAHLIHPVVFSYLFQLFQIRNEFFYLYTQCQRQIFYTSLKIVQFTVFTCIAVFIDGIYCNNKQTCFLPSNQWNCFFFPFHSHFRAVWGGKRTTSKCDALLYSKMLLFNVKMLSTVDALNTIRFIRCRKTWEVIILFGKFHNIFLFFYHLLLTETISDPSIPTINYLQMLEYSCALWISVGILDANK